MQVHTPRGVFALVLRESSWGLQSSGRNVASREQTERAWFFLERELEEPIWGELGAVLDLYAELTGDELSQRDVRIMERVRRAFERALWTGELVFEEVEEPESLPVPKIEYIKVEDLPRPVPAPPEEEEQFIGVQLVDQDGQPVPDAAVRIELPDGSVREHRTDEQGEVMVEGFRMGGQAKVTFLDFSEAEPAS